MATGARNRLSLTVGTLLVLVALAFTWALKDGDSSPVEPIALANADGLASEPAPIMPLTEPDGRTEIIGTVAATRSVGETDEPEDKEPEQKDPNWPEHLENAIRADASLVDARINVSHVYGHTGEFPRAVRHLRQGFEKTGNSALLPALSIYEARAGFLDDALAHLDAVIRSDQATNDHWIYRGLILEQKQLWNEARAHYRTMAQRLPELVDWVGQKLQGLAGPDVVVGIGEPAAWDDSGNARRNDENRHI